MRSARDGPATGAGIGLRTMDPSLWVGWALASSSGCKPPAKAVGVQIPPGPLCHVSGHRGHMSHDIADECTSAETLVVAGGVQGQLAEQRAFLCDDADVGAGDEKSDWAVL